MKPKLLSKPTIILLVLVLLSVGIVYFSSSFVPHAKFSTSYEDYPFPKDAPPTLPEKLVEVNGTINSFSINSDKTKIAIATSKGVSVYDLISLESIHIFPVANGVENVSFSPDGTKLAVLQKNAQSYDYGFIYLMILDTTSWQVLYAYQNDVATYLYSESNQLKWNPDSQRIAFSTSDQGLVIWNPESGNPKLETSPDFVFPYGGFDWSPDGSRLIFTEAGFGLRRWRVDTDDWVRLYDAESQTASRVKWSPNGRYIASGHFGGTVCIWNASNNQCEGFIHAHFNSVDGLAWSPDSTQVATASGAIRIWDIKTGEENFAFGYAENINYTQLEWVSEQITATLETSYTQNISPSIKFWDISTGDVKFAFRGWQELKSPNYDGVTLRVDDIQISDKETLMRTSLLFDYQNVSAIDWDVKLKDEKGKTYPLTRLNEVGFDANLYHIYRTVSLPKDKTFTLELNLPRGIPLVRDVSNEYGIFYFDPSVLKLGEAVELNQEIYASDFLFYLTKAEKISDNEIRFEFFTGYNLDGVLLDSPYITGSTSNVEGKGRFSSTLTFSKIPKGVFEITVDKVYYRALGPWFVEFEIFDSMFVK